MTTIRRWDPRAGLGRIPRHRDFWGPRFDALHNWPNRRSTFGLPVDIHETSERLVVQAAMPGLKPEDFDLTVQDNVLTISCETKSDVSGEEGAYLHRERVFGAFQRSIQLPKTVDIDQGESVYEDGVLTINFPHREEAKPKQIKIQVGRNEGEVEAA